MTKPKQPWRCQKCSCYGKTIPRAYPRSKLCAWCAQELRQTGLRWCAGCKSGKPATEFADRYCRACNSTRSRAWRAAHPDDAKEHNRAYQEAHREEIIAYRRAYYHANRARLLEQKKAYYQANRERIMADMRRRRQLGLIPPASLEKARERHQAKRAIYKANEKIARARRLLKLIRYETKPTSQGEIHAHDTQDRAA